jgi:hypothetical protein
MVWSPGEALGSLGLKIPVLAAAMAESGIEAVEFTITDTHNIAYFLCDERTSVHRTVRRYKPVRYIQGVPTLYIVKKGAALEWAGRVGKVEAAIGHVIPICCSR